MLGDKLRLVDETTPRLQIYQSEELQGVTNIQVEVVEDLIVIKRMNQVFKTNKLSDSFDHPILFFELTLNEAKSPSYEQFKMNN